MDHVLVDIPFVYRIEAVRQRRRKVETIFQIDTVPVRIRVAEKVAPFTVLPFAETRLVRGVRGFVLEGKAHVVLQASVLDKEWGVDVFGSTDFFLTYAPHGFETLPHDKQRSVLLALHKGEAEWYGFDKYVPRIEGLARIVSSNREEAAAKAVHVAAHLVYGGGMLASSLVEPVLRRYDDRSRLHVEDIARNYWRHYPIEDDSILYGMASAAALGYVDRPDGIPAGVDGWAFPDAEKLMTETWFRIETIRRHISFGPIRSTLQRIQEMQGLADHRLLDRDEILEAADLLDGALAHVALHGVPDDELRVLKVFTGVMRSMAKARTNVPGMRAGPVV